MIELTLWTGYIGSVQPVPPDFRNVICPWQTPREIRAQSKFAKKIWNSLSPEERVEIFKLREFRKWKT